MVFEMKFRKARFSVFEADLERHELRKHGVRIKLTEQPFQALALLLEHCGEVVTRERFRETLWPNESWGEHDQRLNRIINKIREALCDSADTPRFVETIPRVGYRFLVEVDRTGCQDAAKPAIPPAHEHPPMAHLGFESSVQLRSAPPSPTSRLGRQPWMLMAGALITGVLAAGLSNRVTTRIQEHVPSLHPVPLTTYIGSELYPSLAPDAARVAFAWDGETKGAYHIYTASTSGGGVRQITNSPRSDAAPAWSPDGERIAFLRNSGPGTAQLWTVRADGGNPVLTREIRSAALNPSLTWTHDQNYLIVAQRREDNGVPALFRISVATGEEVQITSPSWGQFAGDMSPAISADGRWLAFTRSTRPSWRDIFVVRLSNDDLPEGNSVRLTDSRNDIDFVAWAPDGKSLVFSAAATVSAPRHLFRVDSAETAHRPEVSELGIEGDRPTLAGSPFKLAFVRTNIEQSSVWRVDREASQTRKSRVISSTRRDFTTALSPGGEQIVFSSIRSGQTEVWLSRTDGSNLRRLTSMGGSEPRWSPDGKQIAFVSSKFGQSDIYVLRVDNGATRRLTFDEASHLKPSWSRDGRFIYFCSDQTGRPQIWKAPSEGGDAVQITRRGALYAVESFDGKSIYFTTPDMTAEVWHTSVNGGEETPVLKNVLGHASIALSRDGLYYLANAGTSHARLDFLRFADHGTETLTSIDYPVHAFLSSSWDGRSVLYSQIDSQDHDLMLVDAAR